MTTLTARIKPKWLLLVCAASLEAQSLDRSVIGTSGGTVSGTDLVVSSSVGQIANAVRPAPEATLDEGFQPTTSYQRWSSGFTGLGRPEADPDGDGRPNVLEYALGSNPRQVDATPVLTLLLPSNGAPQIRVAKGALAGTDSQLEFKIESSTSLAAGSWSTAGLVVQEDSPSALVVGYAGPPGQVWFRLRVSADTVTP